MSDTLERARKEFDLGHKAMLKGMSGEAVGRYDMACQNYDQALKDRNALIRDMKGLLEVIKNPGSIQVFFKCADLARKAISRAEKYEKGE